MSVARSIAPCGGSAPRGGISNAFLRKKNPSRGHSARVRMRFIRLRMLFVVAVSIYLPEYKRHVMRLDVEFESSLSKKL